VPPRWPRAGATGGAAPGHGGADLRGPGRAAARVHAGAYLALRALPAPVAYPVAVPGWLPAVAVDGKAVRGAAGQDGMIPYLLAAVTHGTGIVLAERRDTPKSLPPSAR
jgi:hypothetical protein